MAEKKAAPMNGYNLTRNFFNYKFENQGALRSIEAEMYFYIVDKWNRLGQIKEIGLPTDFTMQSLEIASYKTYKKALDKLIEHNFILEVCKSKNIHMSRRVALVLDTNANTNALDKATINAHANEDTNEHTNEHTTITKPVNNKKKNNRTINNSLLSEIDISELEDDEIKYFEIAISFQKLFIKNLDDAKSPSVHQKNAKFKNYVDPIRLMMENDGVTIVQLKQVWKYLNSPEGDFWKPNILSTKKLREKFPQLVMKANVNSCVDRNDGQLKRSASNAVDRMFGKTASVQGTFDAIDLMYGEQ